MKYQISMDYIKKNMKRMEDDITYLVQETGKLTKLHDDLEQFIKSDNITEITRICRDYRAKICHITDAGDNLKVDGDKIDAIIDIISQANSQQMTKLNTAPPVILMPKTTIKSSPAPTTAPPQTSVDRTTKCDRTENPDTSKKGCDFNISGKCAQMSDASKCPRRII